jgi:hypothetical protein
MDGSTLTDQERIGTQVEHTLHAMNSDLPAMGEMLVQIGGDRGVVTGALTAEQLHSILSKFEAAANAVCSPSQVCTIQGTRSLFFGSNGQQSMLRNKRLLGR